MKRDKEIRTGDHRGRGRFHTLVGVVIAVMGLFWLTNKFDLAQATTDGSNIVWPILTIAIGLLVVFKRARSKALQ